MTTPRLSNAESFPELAYDDWRDTNHTLHLFLQVVGKVRLGLHPKLNHWWHVPFYASVRGLTTGSIPYGDRMIEMEFDFNDHALHITTSDGDQVTIHLAGQSVAEFYAKVMHGLEQVGVDVTIIAEPFDMPQIPFKTFAECTTYNTYDKSAVETMWRILLSVNNVFREFRGRFLGKSTPVHLFWHHFDLALTRFSGREAPPREGVSQVEREAYSHEVISFGFWFGDDNVREPALYAYGFPAPDPRVYELPLEPAGAFWNSEGGMAMLKYAEVRAADDPRQAILDFLDSTYHAYADVMEWDAASFERP